MLIVQNMKSVIYYNSILIIIIIITPKKSNSSIYGMIIISKRYWHLIGSFNVGNCFEWSVYSATSLHNIIIYILLVLIPKNFYLSCVIDIVIIIIGCSFKKPFPNYALIFTL